MREGINKRTHLEFLGVNIDGDNSLCLRLNAALNNRQTNATHAENSNSGSLFDLRSFKGSSVASSNTATK